MLLHSPAFVSVQPTGPSSEMTASPAGALSAAPGSAMVSPEAAAAVVSAFPPAPVFSEMVSPAVVVYVDFFVSVVLFSELF